jgi:outer membrane protein TolC
MFPLAGALAATLLWPSVGGAQTAPPASTLPLTLADAVNRGLDHNLAVILKEAQTKVAGGGRLAALSELLPHVSADVRESRQVLSTAAFGFEGFGGLPTLIGPFNLFDARLSVSAPIVDVAGWASLKAATSLKSAAVADYQQARETVVLAVGNLYLLALADQARVTAADAQVATAEALAKAAGDQHDAGLVPKIDAVRQNVELQGARAQQIAAANALAVRKLQLARAIGLPAGQAIDLTTTSALSAVVVPDLESAVALALAHRHDLAAAEARVDAAKATARAAQAGYLPTLDVDANVGKLGQTVSGAEKTYTLAATVHIPIFAGGKPQADTARANGELHQREAELADLETGVRYEVQAALLTLQSATAGADVAKNAVELSRDQLAQAQDRFQAGVANTIEVVQAQESVAKASEQYINSLYAHAIAKAALARAMGVVEERFVAMVGGQQ